MKKSILTAIFAMAIVLSAGAQEHKWFIGGEAGFWSAKVREVFNVGGLQNPILLDGDVTQLTITPEIGYNITDKFAVAAALGYLNVSSDNLKINGFLINPYVRYTFLKSGIVSAFVDGGAVFGLSDFNGFQAGITPGIAIALTPRFSVVAHLGFLGYNDGKGVGNFINGKGFGLDLSGYQSQFGFYYSF